MAALAVGSNSSISIAHLSQALFFSGVPDDVLVNILCRLDEDPRDLARLACVSRRFCRVIKNLCWKFRCEKALPVLVAELLQDCSPALRTFAVPPGGWASLQKLLVCCPGLWHAGVLLESWDFGLGREIGWFDTLGNEDGFSPFGPTSQRPNGYPLSKKGCSRQSTAMQSSSDCNTDRLAVSIEYSDANGVVDLVSGDISALTNVGTCIHSHGHDRARKGGNGLLTRRASLNTGHMVQHFVQLESTDLESNEERCKQPGIKKRQRQPHHEHCHVATGPWNLSREQGNKLLANRFRADSLYICDWPGCVHPGHKRIYKLFRGVFKNFKSSHVWRNLKDMHAKATSVGCAFCQCKSTWDMVTTFCLKRSIEFHDDGEPVVRAYVCENGHVAGAWTDRPMYMP